MVVRDAILEAWRITRPPRWVVRFDTRQGLLDRGFRDGLDLELIKMIVAFAVVVYSCGRLNNRRQSVNLGLDVHCEHGV